MIERCVNELIKWKNIFNADGCEDESRLLPCLGSRGISSGRIQSAKGFARAAKRLNPLNLFHSENASGKLFRFGSVSYPAIEAGIFY